MKYKKTMKSINYSILSGLVCIGTLSNAGNDYVFHTSQEPKFTTNLDVNIKAGNKRHINRLGLLIPILQNDHSIFHITLIGMLDSKHAREGNFGLGYRHRSGDTIYGIYGFLDIRRSERKNNFKQLTLGAEILKENFEFRGNIYLPNRKKYEIRDQSKLMVAFDGHRTNINARQSISYEKALRGFDIEAGGSLPSFQALQAYLAYYYFGFDRSAQAVKGYRVRGNLKVNNTISLEAEVNHDKVRKTNYFTGVRFNFSLGGNKKNQLDLLDQKMTQLPVRDIDVVTSETAQRHQDTQLGSIIGKAAVLSNSDVVDAGDLAVSSEEEAEGSYNQLITITDKGAISVKKLVKMKKREFEKPVGQSKSPVNELLPLYPYDVKSSPNLDGDSLGHIVMVDAEEVKPALPQDIDVSSEEYVDDPTDIISINTGDDLGLIPVNVPRQESLSSGVSDILESLDEIAKDTGVYTEAYGSPLVVSHHSTDEFHDIDLSDPINNDKFEVLAAHMKRDLRHEHSDLAAIYKAQKSSAFGVLDYDAITGDRSGHAQQIDRYVEEFIENPNSHTAEILGMNLQSMERTVQKDQGFVGYFVTDPILPIIRSMRKDLSTAEQGWRIDNKHTRY